VNSQLAHLSLSTFFALQTTFLLTASENVVSTVLALSEKRAFTDSIIVWSALILALKMPS